jgi:hypothetical protein
MQTLQSSFYHRGVQGISGIFARYQPTRVGFRMALHYVKFEDKPRGGGKRIDICAGFCPKTIQNVSFFSTSLGAQYNLLPTQEWLYAFGDIRYSSKLQEGNRSADMWKNPYEFQIKTKGINSFIGVGVRAILFKRLTFSLEPALEVGNYRSESKSLDLVTQQTTSENTSFNAFSFASRFWIGVRF